MPAGEARAYLYKINDDLCTAFTSYLNVTMNSTYATNLLISVIVYHAVFFHYVSTLPCFCILLILNHIPQIF